MKATKLKNKYSGLWYDVYENMLADLQLNMAQADIAQYKLTIIKRRSDENKS